MIEEKKNYGFIAPEIDYEKDYVLGGFRSAPEEVLQENGQWDTFIPIPEIQHNPVLIHITAPVTEH